MQDSLFRKINLILIIIIFSQIVGQVYADPQYVQDINESEIIPFIISNYYIRSLDDKSTVLYLDINYSNVLVQKTYKYSDIVIGDISLVPKIDNLSSEILDINASFESIYFYTPNRYNLITPNICSREISRYYDSLLLSDNNIDTTELLDPKFDKDVVIDIILMPRTRKEIIKHLDTVTNLEGNSCFDYLVQNKIITGYDILLRLELNPKSDVINKDKNYSFIIDFDPEFNNLVKPLTFLLNFSSEPTRISLDNLSENYNSSNIGLSTQGSIDFSKAASKYLGMQYIFGGRNGVYIKGYKNLNNGVDCVGLLYLSFKDMGYIDDSMRCVELFRNGWGIADFIEKNKGHMSGHVGVVRNENELQYLKPGDLLFLTTKAGLFGHAGIYVAREPSCYKFIHASSVGKKVIYDCLNGKLTNTSQGPYRYPLYFTRVTNVNAQRIDCSGNLISATNGKANWSSTDYGNPPPTRLTADIG